MTASENRSFGSCNFIERKAPRSDCNSCVKQSNNDNIYTVSLFGYTQQIPPHSPTTDVLVLDSKEKQTFIPADNSSTSQETICPDTTTRKEQQTLHENVQNCCKIHQFEKLPLLQVKSSQWSGFHLCFKSNRLWFCIDAFPDWLKSCSNQRKKQSNCVSVTSVFLQLWIGRQLNYLLLSAMGSWNCLRPIGLTFYFDFVFTTLNLKPLM